MAEFARRRESCRLVRGIICASVILLMTRVAESAIQRVVVIDVAVSADARWHGVHPRQLEAGAVVVERTIRPLHGVMAGLASRR